MSPHHHESVRDPVDWSQMRLSVHPSAPLHKKKKRRWRRWRRRRPSCPECCCKCNAEEERRDVYPPVYYP
ncbi:hypothetical protein VZT92_007678 [Zoarces viviparus]|uniref:Uncharacterized protein n=1 Tax=Zoarces viviparus TaxID=48416 RepID=A0AAW1FKH0_ZOAVI